MGALYLVFQLGRDDGSFPFDGNGLFAIAAVYGGTIGLLSGALLGLGAGVVAGVSTSLELRDGAGVRAHRVGRDTAIGFLVWTVVVLAGFGLRELATSGGRPDTWFGEWDLVLVVALALAFGTWRSGRAARRAVERHPLLHLPTTF